jgi:beta-phosphoglucomutase-like phosphatase (HAD superfamily)
MNISEKLILTDCDGVLLDWKYGFFRWMKEKGYSQVEKAEYDIGKTFGIEKSLAKNLVRNFNESAAIGYLPQFRDAIKYVRKLHEEKGFIFHCITSLSLDEYAGRLRQKNLEAIFGKTVFEKIECLDCGADKDEALEPYRDSGCIFVEDKSENAITGMNTGLQSVLITHDHNLKFNHKLHGIIRVGSWKEIYELLV